MPMRLALPSKREISRPKYGTYGKTCGKKRPDAATWKMALDYHCSRRCCEVAMSSGRNKVAF
jgi:hypothetical protein